ncbi:MAG TPA: peptidylprolyl isomerase [Solirubrobacteraceae bacterium]|nr:peptidylprolyl isomerase [Solirubrobacteraceae bacterium]
MPSDRAYPQLGDRALASAGRRRPGATPGAALPRAPHTRSPHAHGARLLGALTLISLAPFALAACGSGGSATAASSSTRGAPVAGTAGTCAPVARPTPRGAQHVPAPHLTLDPAKHYEVTLATNCGPIDIELDVRQAPRTTASFAYLVRRGFYDDLTFHRVASNFVIQGGDPSGDGSGGPGYTVVEPPPADLRYTFGTVAMAKTATDPSGASGSQFFIVTTADAQLPPQYALVGHVVGSDAGVDAIAKLPTAPAQDGEPLKPVVISHATLVTSG